MKYELLKDLPNLKAGAIGNWNGDRLLFRYGGEVGDTWNFFKDDIENNPEWFRKIDEQEIIEKSADEIYVYLNKEADGITNPPCILIQNPTEQTKQILNGKVFERYIGIKCLVGDGLTNYNIILSETKEKESDKKIFIIIPKEQ